MTDRTITALYNERADAERARDELKAANLNADIDIHDQGGSDLSGAHGEGGIMESLKNFFGGHEDTHAYGEGLSRGHYLLTAKVDDDYTDEAVRILEGSNAIDFDETQATWRNEGWTGQSNAIAQPLSSPPLAGEGLAGETVADSAYGTTGIDSLRGSNAGEQVIPIVEEQLRVGKREVERGGVRVRSYVVEQPVHEQIGLREEHVSIERRPTERLATDADGLFQERNIELTETAEEAVIAKDAVVREELVVRKDASERVEEVNDTVRRTEVDVDDTTRRGTDTSTGRTGI